MIDSLDCKRRAAACLGRLWEGGAHLHFAMRGGKRRSPQKGGGGNAKLEKAEETSSRSIFNERGGERKKKKERASTLRLERKDWAALHFNS